MYNLYFKKNLFIREAEIIAKDIVNILLAGIHTPFRIQSPVDFKLIEDEIFNQKNNLVKFLVCIIKTYL